MQSTRGILIATCGVCRSSWYDQRIMRGADIRNLLKKEPFEPIRLGLSDGRSVLIRHPDQAVASERHLYVGLARVQRSRPLVSPRSGDTFAPDWVPVNLVHITAIEPADGGRPKPIRKRRKRG